MIVLKGHEEFIKNIIQLKNRYLASCSWDDTIRIWN
jgi:WD40 repeat protein